MNKISLWFYSLKWLPKRIVRSAWALVRLLYFRPQYTFLAAIISVIFYEIIFWLTNPALAHYLFTTPLLSFSDKMDVVVRSYTAIVSLPLSPLATILFLVSVLQGVAVAGVVFLMRNQTAEKKSIAREMRGTGIAGLLSAIGLGCAACGTSLLMPVFAFFFTTSSAALVDTIGFYSAIAALIAAVITVHIIGLKVAVLAKKI